MPDALPEAVEELLSALARTDLDGMDWEEVHRADPCTLAPQEALLDVLAARARTLLADYDEPVGG